MNRLHEIAIQCTPFLDGKWRYLKSEAETDYRQRAVLQDDTERGRRIIVSDYYGGEGRIQVTGSFPDKHYVNLKITLGMSRSIPALAAEINHRFLSKYLEHYQEAKKLYNQQLERTEAMRIRVNLLKQIVPSICPSWNSNRDVATEYFLEKGKLHLSPYDDDVRLDIRLSFEQLVKVLYLLK